MDERQRNTDVHARKEKGQTQRDEATNLKIGSTMQNKSMKQEEL